MNERARWYADRASRAFVVRGYLPRLALLSLAWEVAQLPLYTIWREARPATIAYAVAHCTLGDVMIGSLALVMALIVVGAGVRARWPLFGIAALTVLLAAAYTLASEILNLTRGNWAYAPAMPLLPGLGVGLAPLLQWLAVPPVALWWAQRASSQEACHDK